MKRIMLIAAALMSSSAFATPVLLNGSFESNTVGSGYAYGNVASDWSFTGGAGVSANNTAWGGTASSGDYFAFLQNISSISQTFVSTVADNFTFSFDLALRPNYATGQEVMVSLDGTELGLYTPSLGWTTETVSVDDISAGSHTLTFAGITDTDVGDTSAFLDNVGMTATSVPEPKTLALLALGLGLLGLFVKRRSA